MSPERVFMVVAEYLVEGGSTYRRTILCRDRELNIVLINHAKAHDVKVFVTNAHWQLTEHRGPRATKVVQDEIIQPVPPASLPEPYPGHQWAPTAGGGWVQAPEPR